MNRPIQYLLFILLIICNLGCETGDAIILPSDERLLNAQCFFSKDKKFEVTVTQPIGLDQGGQPVYPDDCTVEIVIPGVGSDKLKWVKGPNEKGTYLSNSIPIVGLNYFIKISKNGYPNLTAENFIPPTSFIENDSIELSMSSETPANKTFLYSSALNYSPPLTNENYYFFLFGESIIEVTDPNNGNVSFRNSALQIDEIKDIEKNSIVSFDKSFILSGNNTNETIRPLVIRGLINTAAINEKVVKINWTLLTVSKAYFLYINSINTQLLSGNNPLETPSPLYTNFKNGFGVFAGYSEYKIVQTVK